MTEEINEYKIMDNRDELQIIEELQGHYLTEFVYSFKAGNREVIGLSWSGIKEIAYRMGGIQIESCNIEDKADFWLVTCKALDIERKSSRFGVATQNKSMKHKDGSVELDDFALQKAMSKAQRNAIRALIPEVTAKQYISMFTAEKQGGQKSKDASGNPEKPKDVTPPPQTTNPQATICPGCGANKDSKCDLCFICYSALKEQEKQ